MDICEDKKNGAYVSITTTTSLVKFISRLAVKLDDSLVYKFDIMGFGVGS